MDLRPSPDGVNAEKRSQRAVSRILFPAAALADDGATMTIPLASPLLARSSDLPGGSLDGPSSRHGAYAPLFGLAPCGVLPATRVATRAVRSYRTFSPLPFDSRSALASRSLRAVFFLCHFPSGCPDRGLPGALPCGVRTFLSVFQRSGHLARCEDLILRYPSVSWLIWYCSSFL